MKIIILSIYYLHGCSKHTRPLSWLLIINGHSTFKIAKFLQCGRDDGHLAPLVLLKNHLKSSGAVGDNFGGMPECSTGLVLALSGDDLGPGLPGGLGLGSHSPLQLLRYPHVLHLNPLHLHPPRVRRLVQGALQRESSWVT